MGFVFVILFLISYSITEGSVPSLTNSTVEVKRVSLLGVDVTLAAYTLEFDQDLYLFRSGLCSAANCSNDDTVHIDQDECVCDYTNTTANCGQGVYYNGTGACDCTEAATLCDASRSTWVDINVQGLNTSKSVQRSIAQGGTHNFRLFVNESCFGFRAFINTEYGSTSLLISNKGIATYTNSFWAHNNDDTKPDFNICPTNGHYIRGTYFLSVKAYSDAKYELVIQPLYVPAPTVTPDTYTCQPYWPPPQTWLAPANCLSDGVPYKTQCPSYFLGSHYFNVSFPDGECSYLHISLETYGKGLEAGILAGYVDEAPTDAPFFNSTWGNVLGNMVSSIVCPRHQNESWAMIWIGVPCWVSGSDYSNYTIFATTKHSDKWTSERLADITPFESNNALLGIAQVILPKSIGTQGNLVTCTDRTKNCQQLSFALASQNLNPFFPVPPMLVNLQGETDLFLSITGNFTLPIPYIPKPNAVSLLVLMAYDTSSSVTLLDYEDADDVVIKFLGKVGSISGETINQNFTATIRSPACVYSDFVDSVNTINSIIEELSEAESTNELNSIRYKLDSATFQSNYYACQQFVDNLTSAIDSNTTVTESSFACTIPQTDPAWAIDPCCNSKASWDATCYPQNINVTLTDYSVQQDSVAKMCKHSQCSQSYLEDYALAKSSFQSGQCSIQTDVALEVPAVQKKYRYCKQQALDVGTCYADSDCFYANQSYSCNIFSRACMIPHEVQEKYFMECLSTQLTEAQETYLQQKYNITTLMEDPQFIEDWYSKIATTDCVATYGSTVSLAHRNRAVFAAANTDCAESTSCPSFECEDTTCQYPELNCFVICQGAVLSYENSAQTECLSDVQCNWDADLCENLSEQACTDTCVNNHTASFCGLCQNGECVEFAGLSETACASTTVCALHNGTYMFNITEAQCTGLAECNVPCGYTCQSLIPTFSQGICYSYPADSTQCSSLGGVWTSNSGTQSNSSLPNVCVFYGQTATSCQSISGASFDTCSSLSDYACNQCTQGSCLSLGQSLLLCGLAQEPCQNAATCANAGTCTDSEYFVNPDYAMYGACEVPRYPPVDGVSDYPFCLPQQYSVPNGCIDFSATSEATCSGTWHFPAENSTQCTAQKGCLDLAGNQLRFSPKSETDCTSEYTQGSWESYYEWTPGRWVGGVQRNLTWTTRQTFTKYQWDTTASFFNLQADYFGSASHILALQSKSAALCQYERTLDPMQSVVCDCTESGSSDCFQTSSTSSAIAQLQICEQTPFSSSYPGVMVTAFNNSVELFCADILLSKISANNFKTHTAERLLANFVPFSEKEVPDFAVFNHKNAAIGSLVSDGVSITPLGEASVNKLELCLKKTINHNFDFPVQDFGVDKGDEIVPLHMEAMIYLKVIANNSVDDGTYFCAIINVTTERHYFAIERKSNYENVDEQKLTPVAKIFTYTLAIIFLVASAAVTGQLILYLHSWYAGSLPLILEHFLVFFIWLFVCVRTIYFFLVTTGFDSQIGDYALVALPTFFYFTAFTIIVILWAVVASKRFTNDIEKFKRVINRAVIIINALLYATFVALILAFQYGKTAESSPCGSRQDSETNTDEIRRNVSVAYGLIISITSFIIGVLFIIFGFRIRNFIMANESNERIFIVTAVCSVCFILHCAFILAVSFMNQPNLYFSFFGLLLTEWLPAIFITGWLFFRRRNVLLSGSSNNTGGSHVITHMKSNSKSGSGSRQVELRHLESSITQDDYRS